MDDPPSGGGASIQQREQARRSILRPLQSPSAHDQRRVRRQDGDFDLAGADEAAGPAPVGGHKEIGAADGEHEILDAYLLVTATRQLAEAHEALLERAGRFVAAAMPSIISTRTAATI